MRGKEALGCAAMAEAAEAKKDAAAERLAAAESEQKRLKRKRLRAVLQSLPGALRVLRN